METDVIKYENITVELEQRPSKALRRFGNGRLYLSLKGESVWGTGNFGERRGIEWTWGELLSFLTSNWAWLLNEQGLPLPLKFPDVLAGTAANVCENLAQKNGIAFTNAQKRTLRAFCLRHDLAESAPGIVLPSLFVLRMGDRMLLSSERAQILMDIKDAKDLLSQIGDIICRWMRPYADAGTQVLLDAWERREDEVKEIILSRKHLLARMDKETFLKLTQEVHGGWEDSWEGTILQEGEMLAAARMSAGFVPLEQQIEILNAILTCPASNIEKIDAISTDLSELSSACIQDYKQGYALASRLREILGKQPDTPLNPEEFLEMCGVRIQEMAWKNSPLDALSCWSSTHGPLILLNIADGKRCSHEYGRRFTLGHELCHLLIDRGHALGLVDVLGGGMPDFIERRANAFAAEILLPRHLVVSEFQSYHDEIKKFHFFLREKYKVPRKTAASQIYNSPMYDMLQPEDCAYFSAEVDD